MTIKSQTVNKALLLAFINAVNTWKAYVKALKAANMANNNVAKKWLGKAVFYWRKEAEKLKNSVDSVLFVC